MGSDLERIGTAISPALQQAGVALVRQEDGYVAITGLDALRTTHHVLMPVESVAQADPFYVPSVNTIKLTVDDHTYRDQNGKRALNKNGLLLLAQAAGIGQPRTWMIPRSALKESQVGWQATVTVRRSDGTTTEFTASRVVDSDLEREKIKAQCVNANGELDRGKFFTRWAKEADVLMAKCETKAMLRAIRQALAVRGGGYEPRDFDKPFLCVAYNFRPDYTDPEIRRMAMERGIGASRDLYGPETPFGPQGELPAVPPPSAAEAPRGAVQQVDLGTDERSIEEEEAEDAEVVTVEFTALPDAAPVDPQKAAWAAEAGALQITAGKFAGRTVGEIASEDPTWLRMVADNANDPQTKKKLQAFVELNLQGG